MNSPWNAIAELEANGSRLAKEAIIKREATAGNSELFRGFRAALDSMITFGVKKVEEKSGDGKGITADRFWDVAQRLAERKLTGNAALTAINQLRLDSKELEWNGWYRRILIKDLRCGISDKTINKITDKINSQFSVPVFTCQLAHDGANYPEKVTGVKQIEVKLDGVRVITVVYPDGKVDQFSRNGKELVNFPHIKDQISKHARMFAEPMVLDGEVMSASFQDLMKQVHRKSDVNAADAVLNLFDIVTLKEFMAGTGKHRQIDRSFSLATWFEHVKDHTPNVQTLGYEIVDLNTAEGQARFKEINKKAIDNGYEGIMIKDPEAPYECKRTVSWLKIKPFIEVSLTVKAAVEGTGKNLGRMGALECDGYEEEIFIEVSVGSGFSDKQRDEIWAAWIQNPNSIRGQIAEVRADAITKNQDGTYSLRFPRFKCFRGFVAGEKL
jgi:DNA ligase-1